MNRIRKEFYFVRHAESLANIGLDAGFDPDLSPAGRIQTMECAEYMSGICDSSTSFFTSPFKRCVETSARICIKSGIKAVLEPMLQEYFAVEWFPFNRLRLPSLKKICSENKFILDLGYDDSQWWPEKNEKPEDLDVRLGILKNFLLGKAVSAGKIVCVGHWASVAGIVESMCPDMPMKSVENASVSRIDYDGQNFFPAFLNNVSFLSRPTQKIPKDIEN